MALDLSSLTDEELVEWALTITPITPIFVDGVSPYDWVHTLALRLQRALNDECGCLGTGLL